MGVESYIEHGRTNNGEDVVVITWLYMVNNQT